MLCEFFFTQIKVELCLEGNTFYWIVSQLSLSLLLDSEHKI